MRRAWIPLAVAALAACSGGGEADYPTRDWSGSYLTRMVSSSSDCKDASVPPPIPEFIAELRQDPSNRAIIWMNPVIQLEGVFHGDALEASMSMVDALNLPDSLAARIEPADSFDNVTYHLSAELTEDWRLTAEYEIRAPDVRALLAGEEPLRCTMRYELAGTRFEPPALSQQPWLDSLRGSPARPGATAEPVEPR